MDVAAGDEPFFPSLVLVLRSQHISVVAEHLSPCLLPPSAALSSVFSFLGLCARLGSTKGHCSHASVASSMKIFLSKL